MPCHPAISSHSLGRAWVHDMPSKLDAAARHRFDIELFYEDLWYVAKALPGGDSRENKLQAARIIRSLCDERDIKIICLQPFMNFEGLRDRAQHAKKLEELKLWIEIAHILRTDMIAVPSTILPKDTMSGDMDLIVSDLRKAADLGAAEGIRLTYESLCWGTYSDTWEMSWEVVKRVDRANFGLCLDTFNIAGRVFADPAAISGKTPNAETDFRASMERLVNIIDVVKIFFVQVVDAERLSKPLVEGHTLYDADQPARMSWSRSCRLFYGEQDRGGYLPIDATLKAILTDLGYDGYVSAEYFNQSLVDASPSVPEEHARRAAISWQKIVGKFGPWTETDEKGSSKRSEQLARAQL